MSSLVPQLILIGLAASISPVAVMILISVLSRHNARRNSLVWLLGFTLTLLALGFAGVYLLHAGGSGGTSKVDGYIDIALGVLCLLLIPWSLLKRDRKEGRKVESDPGIVKVFTLGCISMVINASTFVIFVSGLHVITSSDIRTSEGFICLAILTFFTLTTVLVPIAIYFAFPTKAEGLLASFSSWLTKHKKVINIVVLLIFGIYLLAKGLKVVI
jgi:threonine/homoserine/homoserine lactone efflux protein